MVASGNPTEARLRGDPKSIFVAGTNGADRFPLFRVGCERVGTQWAKSAKGMLSIATSLRLDSIQGTVVLDHVGRDNGFGLCAVLEATAWSVPVLLTIDCDALASVVEGLLGGDGAVPALPVQRRATKIETRLARLFFDRMMQTIETAFQPVLAPQLVLRRIVDRPRLNDIGRRSESLLVARYRLEGDNRSGTMLLAMPYAAIAAHRQQFARTALEEPKAADPRWGAHIQAELAHTNVTLRATLDEREATLDEIANLEVGAVLTLRSGTASPVRVSCNGQSLFWCRLGQADGAFTLRVVGSVDHEQEFVDDLLADT